MGIQDHLTFLLRNQYAGQETTVREVDVEHWMIPNRERSKSRLYLSPCLLNLYAAYIMKNARLDEAQDCREKYQEPQIYRWHHPCCIKQRGTKDSPDESERGESKSWLKTQHSKTKIMASGPPTSWQIDGETMETVTYFIFLGSKITTDGDCSHEIKRHLLLWRKAMTNLDSIL